MDLSDCTELDAASLEETESSMEKRAATAKQSPGNVPCAVVWRRQATPGDFASTGGKWERC